MSTKEVFVFFFRPLEANGKLSNWSEHSIKENNIIFDTVEHYIMYHKAVLMNDMNTATLIKTAKNPAEAKKLGRLVKNYDDEKWVKHRINVINRALQLKVEQNPDVLLLLQSFYNENKKDEKVIFAEASPFDSLWGIGLSKSSLDIYNKEKWGLNLLGKAWTKIYDDSIRKEN